MEELAEVLRPRYPEAAAKGGLYEAESRVNEVYFTWRAGGDTPLNAALDEMLATWSALGEGEELVMIRPDR